MGKGIKVRLRLSFYSVPYGKGIKVRLRFQEKDAIAKEQVDIFSIGKNIIKYSI
jgi:hypothetical protein